MDTVNASPKRSLRLSGLLASSLVVASGLWLSGSAEPAFAQSAPDYKASEAVSYADLDLTSADGARTLLRRINLAAKRVCGPEPARSPLQPHLIGFYERCVTDSVDATVVQVNSPLLSAMNGEQKTVSAALASR